MELDDTGRLSGLFCIEDYNENRTVASFKNRGVEINESGRFQRQNIERPDS